MKYSNKEITSYQSQASFYNQNILTNQIFGASLFADNVVTNNNTTDNYFDIVSDSIGCIANSKFIQLDSTLPLFDVSQQYYGTPIPIAASTDSKISANTRNVMYNLSQKTTMYMKRNLLNIGYTNLTLQQNLAADATTSHGLNLINDLPTFVNINKMLDQFKSALGAVFSQAKAFSFVQYLNNIGNTTAVNLRDIFPVVTSDRDFIVVTSEQAAQASVAQAQQEQSDANAAAALAQQQQSLANNNVAANYVTTGSVTNSNPNPTGPIVNGQYQGTIPGDSVQSQATAYSPQGGGSAMEGGYESAYRGPDGQKTVQTLQDYATGNSNYVTIAGDPTLKGQTYIIPQISYTDPSGNTQTLHNVPAMVQDTGSAFSGAGTTHFDIPIYNDGTNSQMTKQPFTTTPVTFTSVTKSTFNSTRTGTTQYIAGNSSTPTPGGA